ncbi:MAG: HU family DNA-binding protein [Bacteroidaceae bacterium]|nr:HU family DNA-binding protein [Bacteroidaceae bacterium]
MGFRVTKQEITLHYREDKPTAYKLQLVREQVVKYKQLCKNIAATTGIRKGEVEDVLDALSQQMVQMMELGHPVQLGIMGTFKPTLQTKCAKSMDELSVDNVVRRRIQFIPGEVFKDMLADMEIETESDDDDAPASGGSGSTDNGGEQEGGTDFT